MPALSVCGKQSRSIFGMEPLAREMSDDGFLTPEADEDVDENQKGAEAERDAEICWSRRKIG